VSEFFGIVSPIRWAYKFAHSLTAMRTLFYGVFMLAAGAFLFLALYGRKPKP
jgi:hypothetical protein